MGKGEIIESENGEVVPNYRNYVMDTSVSYLYRENHIKQNIENNLKFRQEILPIGKTKLNIFEVIDLMGEIVDESDPDSRNPQIVHSIQTGEACRKLHPDKDWFHLTGFIHDLGKVSAHKLLYSLPQWAVVGDTFPIGCAFSDKIIYNEFFTQNSDTYHELYGTKLGIYKEGIGFENMIFSWGHDEYLYQVLKANYCKLPEEALYIIRFHSFYPWHENSAYDNFADEKDLKMLPFLKDFQLCDLYSKVDEKFDIEERKKYYEKLIEKYFDSPILKW